MDTGVTASIESEPTSTDLVELYYERGWRDGLPVVPQTQDKIDAMSTMSPETWSTYHSHAPASSRSGH